MITIDAYSRITVPLKLFYNEARLGNATAFVWEHEGDHYLITNWHVLTGKDPNTDKVISKTGGVPNRLIAYFNSVYAVFEKEERELLLFDGDGNPRWLCHRGHGQRIDIVALPLPKPDAMTFNYCPVNTMKGLGLSVEVAMDVFILGYPFGAIPPYLPVWKRGSIATEPQLSQVGDKYMLVDTASRPGMSGAPVFRRSWGTHLTEGGGRSMTNGSATKFIGIYSGRYDAKTPLESQLGMVWPAFWIDELFLTVRSACRRD